MLRLGATPKSWGDELVHLALFFQPQKASGDFSLLPNAKHGQAGQAGLVHLCSPFHLGLRPTAHGVLVSVHHPFVYVGTNKQSFVSWITVKFPSTNTESCTSTAKPVLPVLQNFR